MQTSQENSLPSDSDNEDKKYQQELPPYYQVLNEQASFAEIAELATGKI